MFPSRIIVFQHSNVLLDYVALLVVYAKLWFMESKSLWEEKHRPLGPEVGEDRVRIWLFLTGLGCSEAVEEASSSHLQHNFNTA